MRRSAGSERAMPGVQPGIGAAAAGRAQAAPAAAAFWQRWPPGARAERAATGKRVVFRNTLLPYLLVAPQLAITLVFFIWPASQALWQSMFVQDPFGLSTQFVGWQNFIHLFPDPGYLHSVRVTIVFSASVTALSLSVALLLAAMADRVIRGATGYKTLLIWPYAVAPAVAGVLWCSCSTRRSASCPT
jgi:ABC-type sugar transport system permease subunit